MGNTTHTNSSSAAVWRRNFYKWHRILGIIALVPVISFALSGMLHPFMSNWFRPSIPKEQYKVPSQQKMHPALSLTQVLNRNKITQLRNYGLVSFKGQTYYQVLTVDSVCQYYSANDGALLPNGDRLYAEFLARYFTGDQQSAISSIGLQKQFDEVYQPINRLLPVWKVSFDRPDGMDIYVETTQSRLGTFNNHTRKTFLWLFEQLHNWDFLASWFGNKFRLVVLLLVTLSMLASLITGSTIYGLLWQQFKNLRSKQKASGKQQRILHRYHRQLGLAVSLVMLCFAFSAAFHVWVKLGKQPGGQKYMAPVINLTDLKIDNFGFNMPDSAIKKQGLVIVNNKPYYRVPDAHKKIVYLSAADGQALPGGDFGYARQLAALYGAPATQPIAIKPVFKFTDEYGFINKRLPVVMLAYPGKDNWYMETSTGQLAAHVAGIDRTEGFSFIFLHKFFLMSWAGKDIRDVVSILSALGVLVVALLGIAGLIQSKN